MLLASRCWPCAVGVLTGQTPATLQGVGTSFCIADYASPELWEVLGATLVHNVATLSARGVLELAAPREGVVPWPAFLVPLAAGAVATKDLAVGQ